MYNRTASGEATAFHAGIISKSSLPGYEQLRKSLIP
jgi:hypothetical protein